MDSGLREGDWLIQVLQISSVCQFSELCIMSVREKGITSKDFNLVHACWWSSDRVAFIRVMAFSAA